MPLSTKDCIAYITDWVSRNPDALIKDDYALELKTSGQSPWISDGTKAKDWRRRAKRKVGGRIYRAFDLECTIYKSTESVVLLVEENDKITHIDSGVREYLEAKYPIGEIKYSFS